MPDGDELRDWSEEIGRMRRFSRTRFRLRTRLRVVALRFEREYAV